MEESKVNQCYQTFLERLDGRLSEELEHERQIQEASLQESVGALIERRLKAGLRLVGSRPSERGAGDRLELRQTIDHYWLSKRLALWHCLGQDPPRRLTPDRCEPVCRLALGSCAWHGDSVLSVSVQSGAHIRFCMTFDLVSEKLDISAPVSDIQPDRILDVKYGKLLLDSNGKLKKLTLKPRAPSPVLLSRQSKLLERAERTRRLLAAPDFDHWAAFRRRRLAQLFPITLPELERALGHPLAHSAELLLWTEGTLAMALPLQDGKVALAYSRGPTDDAVIRDIVPLSGWHLALQITVRSFRRHYVSASSVLIVANLDTFELLFFEDSKLQCLSLFDYF